MKTYPIDALVLVVTVISASSADADAWFEIKAVHSNKWLEVRHNGKADRDLIEQSTWTRTDNQLWKWDAQHLKNKGSGKPGRSDKDWVQLQQVG